MRECPVSGPFRGLSTSRLAQQFVAPVNPPETASGGKFSAVPSGGRTENWARRRAFVSAGRTQFLRVCPYFGPGVRDTDFGVR